MTISSLTLLLAAGAYFGVRAYYKRQKNLAKPHIEVEVLRLEPESGSELKVGEPVTVHMRYRFSGAYAELPYWVHVQDCEQDYTYQGSCDRMMPGEAEVSRYVHLNEPGEIKKLQIRVSNEDFAKIYTKDIEVDYRYVENEAITALRDDGIGSRITNISFSAEQGATLKIGSTIDVLIDYQANTEHGVDIYAIPLVDCNMSYSPTSEQLTGTNRVTQSFWITEPYQVRQVRVVMVNQGKQILQQEDVAVNFRFVA